MGETSVRAIERALVVGLVALAIGCVDALGFVLDPAVTRNEPAEPAELELRMRGRSAPAKVIGTDITFTNGWGSLALYNCTRNASNACQIERGTGSTAPVYSGNYGYLKKAAGGSSSAYITTVLPTYMYLPPGRRFKAQLRGFRPSTTTTGRLIARLKVDGVARTIKYVTPSTAANKWVKLSFTWDNTSATPQTILFSVEGLADGSTAAFEYRLDNVQLDDVAIP